MQLRILKFQNYPQVLWKLRESPNRRHRDSSKPFLTTKRLPNDRFGGGGFLFWSHKICTNYDCRLCRFDNLATLAKFNSVNCPKSILAEVRVSNNRTLLLAKSNLAKHSLETFSRERTACSQQLRRSKVQSNPLQMIEEMSRAFNLSVHSMNFIAWFLLEAHKL